MKKRIGNWSRTQSSAPEKIERPDSVDAIVRILKDPAAYPSPVRAMGNFHSTTGCVNSEGGTILNMLKHNKILSLEEKSVTVQAGMLYKDLTKKLNKQGLNLPVNLQVGNVTVGSVACCATKDGSYTGVFGQAGAYVTKVKLIRPNGDIEVIDESQAELLAAVRSSYGLMGVIVEVTFQIVPLKTISVEHQTYSFDRFVQKLPELKALNKSIELYIFPISDRITVQLRGPGKPNSKINRWVWWIRNQGVQHGMPIFTRMFRLVPFKSIRYACIHFVDRVARKILVKLVKSDCTNPADQTTDYAHRPLLGAFTFSIWGFPEADYPRVLMAYQAFCQKYYAEHGYQPDMLTVGYRVIQNQNALLSYCFEGPAMTIDPVAIGCKDWQEFALAFNDFAVAHGGQPLLNQTPQLNAGHLNHAFGKRWQDFKNYRDQYDPDNRLLNKHFAALI